MSKLQTDMRRRELREREEVGIDFINCYEDVSRADACATLECANTYHLCKGN